MKNVQKANKMTVGEVVKILKNVVAELETYDQDTKCSVCYTNSFTNYENIRKVEVARTGSGIKDKYNVVVLFKSN